MKKHRSAFTLIELLIAVLIFSVIVTVIYSTFSTGTSVWKRTKVATQIHMNINSVMKDLAKELQSAVNYKGLEFIGERSKLYFCHLSDTVLGDSQYKEIYRTCYYIEPSGGEAGRFDLVKKGSSLIGGGFDIDEISEDKVISGLDDFQIEYAYRSLEEEIAWQKVWKYPDIIPRGIRVTIRKGDIKLTKYISVPTGILVTSGVE